MGRCGRLVTLLGAMATSTAMGGACSGGGTSSAASGTDAGGAGDDAAATGDAGACPYTAPPPSTPCSAFTSPPTLSCALAAWPRFDPITAADWTAQASVTTHAVSGSPAGVVLSPDGAHLFSAERSTAGGRLDVLGRTQTTLADGGHVNFAITPTVEQPFGVALSPDGTKLGVGLTDRMSVFDVAKLVSDPANAYLGGAATPLSGPQPSTIEVAFSRDGSLLFGANEYERQVSVIDVDTMTYVGRIPLAANAVTSVVVSPDGKYLYVTAEVADAFATSKQDAGTAAPPDQNIGTLTIVDVAKAKTDPANAVLGQVFVGRGPVRTILSPDGSVAWVTARGSNALIALDTTKLLTDPACALISVTAVGDAPVGEAVLPGGSRIAVANSSRFSTPVPPGTVMIVDAADALAKRATAVRGQITVGRFPRAFAADATSLFVANFDDQTVGGIDLTKLPP